MGHFFIENPFGVLILGILGAIIGGFYLEKRHQVHQSITGKITREGVGYNLIRALGHTFRILLFAWQVKLVVYYHGRSGFSSGAFFMFFILSGFYYFAWEMRSCGLTLMWALGQIEAAVNAISLWAKPKASDGGTIVSSSTPIAILIEHLDTSVYSYSISEAADKELRNRQAESVEPLIAALSCPEAQKLQKICTLLGRTHDLRAVTPLMEVIKTGEPMQKRSAALGLSWMPSEALVSLVEALDDDDAEVVDAAAFSLGLSRDIRSLKPLSTLFDKSIRHLELDAENMYLKQYQSFTLPIEDKYKALVEQVKTHRNDSAWGKARSAAKNLANLAEMGAKKLDDQNI